MNYEELETNLLQLAKEELGETSGGGQLIEKETWWWNQQVKESTKVKKDAFKKRQLSGEEQDHEQYKVKKKEIQKAVAIAKENAYEDLYQKLDSREGTDMIYKLAKTRNRRTKDISDTIYSTSMMQMGIYQQTMRRSRIDGKLISTSYLM